MNVESWNGSAEFTLDMVYCFLFFLLWSFQTFTKADLCTSHLALIVKILAILFHLFISFFPSFFLGL